MPTRAPSLSVTGRQLTLFESMSLAASSIVAFASVVMTGFVMMASACILTLLILR
ncbi:hypothetical protein X758_31560 [Mesorhizobium sp. LSHC416B00]|nr:hypothetical protein X758_31560 [Mesorhizobium sp. LSHC416B00]